MFVWSFRHTSSLRTGSVPNPPPIGHGWPARAGIAERIRGADPEAMHDDVEWVVDEAAGNEPREPVGDAAPAADVLELGSHRPLGRWRRRLAIDRSVPPMLARLAAPLAVLLVIGGYALISGGGTASSPGPTRSQVPAAAGGQLDVLFAIARSGAPTDYVRPNAPKGICVVVPMGSQVEQRVRERLRQTIPGFAVRDVAHILDQSTALCSLQVRAVDRAGTVMVIRITTPEHRSPHRYTALSIAVGDYEGTTVCLAEALTPAGWTVTVGSVGRPADAPSSDLLMRLAQDPLLTW
jgi:hypothetical protein